MSRSTVTLHPREWTLVETGYTVELDVWDWAAEGRIVAKMRDALDGADRVMAFVLQLLWRIGASFTLPADDILPDGTYLSRLKAPRKLRKDGARATSSCG